MNIAFLVEKTWKIIECKLVVMVVLVDGKSYFYF